MHYNVQFIRRLREEMGLSVSKMSEVLGYVDGDHTYYRFEQGRADIPITRSGLIAYMLDCHVHELFIVGECKRLNIPEEKLKSRYRRAYKGRSTRGFVPAV
ncbi:helix-turn-helix domain-containing protein [Bacillus cereus]|uniref:HTH cro/C1-type domain-containing protein n=1 Tax=Bacillus cereus VD184 TaxID=1053242 RepID=A0A9W5R271_BACCE|nr:helix-turn-helix transcriptional regulator [Bacillus cereus]EOQ04913.1 hypothetical protein IKC_06290 [Bacillus cereus VD184]